MFYTPPNSVMINLLALSLLAVSLAAAGLWSPPPQPPDHRVVKEGHRVIVVEHESEDTGSPDRDDQHRSILPPLHEVKEKLKEAVTVLPKVGQGLSTYSGGASEEITPHEDAGTEEKPTTYKKRICDAYGNCKEKIYSVFGNAKEKAAEVGEKATDTVTEKGQQVIDKGRSAKEKIEENAETAYNKAKDVKDAATDKGKSFTDSVHGKAKTIEKKVADGVRETKDSAKTLGKDVAGNLTHAANTTAKNLSDISHQMIAVAKDAWAWIWSFKSLRAVAGIGHLLAFSATYGACLWVTFISSHLLANSLSPHQFGLVQSKIYPIYFQATAYGIGFTLLFHILSKEHFKIALPDYNLLVSLGSVLVNLFYLEPLATKVMSKRFKLEKEEGKVKDLLDGSPELTATNSTSTKARPEAGEVEALKVKIEKLNGRLKSLNNSSSFYNVLSLMGLTWHLVYLAQRLQISY